MTVSIEERLLINIRTAVVIRTSSQDEGIAEIEIEVDGRPAKAVNYEDLTGPVIAGDKVIVNTTAVDLALGSGGYGFVLWNLARGAWRRQSDGHLMKLRYTPFQHAGLSVEEQDSPDHDVLKEVTEIDGLPVIACGLHSQLLPVCATLKAVDPELKIVYIMTDGGALPLGFSKTARWLRDKGFISATITAGQAFGGDFEAVNIYSAMAAAKYVAKADVAVVAMGPGIVGTGTVLGHTGVEQGQLINAAGSLGGRPIAVLRLGQKDSRPRHQGISHHSVTALTIVAMTSAIVPTPQLGGDLMDMGRSIDEQIKRTGIDERHNVCLVKNEVTLPELEKIVDEGGPKASTMGRNHVEEPIFFLGAGAAAIAAMNLLDP